MNDVMTNTKPAAPTAITPGMKGADKLTALASRYVDVADLPWKPTPCAGIEMKVLVEDPATGLLHRAVPLAAGRRAVAARARRDRADLCPRRQPRRRGRRGHRRQLRLAAQGQPPYRALAERRAGAVDVPAPEHLPFGRQGRRAAAVIINPLPGASRDPFFGARDCGKAGPGIPPGSAKGDGRNDAQIQNLSRPSTPRSPTSRTM